MTTIYIILLTCAIYIAIVVTIVSIRIGSRLKRTVSVKVKAENLKACITAFSKVGWINVSVKEIKSRPGVLRVKFVR